MLLTLRLRLGTGYDMGCDLTWVSGKLNEVERHSLLSDEPYGGAYRSCDTAVLLSNEG